MADADKEKAEKLAAAKKRFEQLKKEQAKKAKKGPSKAAAKREDSNVIEESSATADEAVAAGAAPSESTEAVEDDDTAPQPARGGSVEGEGEPSELPSPTTAAPSVSQQSKQRSASFRQRAGSTALSPSAEGATAEVQELYRKQAARIEELERDNRELRGQQDTGAARLAHAEEELDALREDSSGVAALKSRAKEAEQLRAELAGVQRQLAQAQQHQHQHQQASAKNARRVSSHDDDARAASKTATIESLELEISNLRHALTGVQGAMAEREASARELEERTVAAEAATAATQAELDALRVSLAFPPGDDDNDGHAAGAPDADALTKRVTVLESDLRTAHTQLEAAAKRATSLEQKIEALTKLHREGTAAAQTKERELAGLRAELKTFHAQHQRQQQRASHVRDVSEFELGDEETEVGQLQARIRALEAENFDLRREGWRERRATLQPGIEDGDAAAAATSPGANGEYEDVDLFGPYGKRDRVASPTGRQTSSFQDVIASGITAFTGRARDSFSPGASRPMGHDRRQSLGLLSEDGFDEDAFRLAQEEDAKRRLERVREVKRGLENWKGWRVDIADLRRNGLGGAMQRGPVFEI